MGNLPFGFERPEESPGFLLWQTTMIWQRYIKKALEPHAVSHAQFVLLATLMWFEAHEYDTTQTSIVCHTNLDKMTVSKSLKKLETVGYVQRMGHSADTRAKNVRLTKKGKEVTSLLVPIVEEVDRIFFGKQDISTQRRLIEILGELCRLQDGVS